MVGIHLEYGKTYANGPILLVACGQASQQLSVWNSQTLVVQPCAPTPNATYPLYPLSGSNTTVSDVFTAVFVDNLDLNLDGARLDGGLLRTEACASHASPIRCADFYVAVFTEASEAIHPTRAHIRGNIHADADSEPRDQLL